MPLTPSHSLPAQDGRAPKSWSAGLSPAATLAARLAARVRGTASPLWAAQLGGLIVALTGTTALFGWLTGSRWLTAGADHYIPMAPNTAVVFVLLGFAVCSVAVGSRESALVAPAAAGLALLLAGTRLVEYLAGVSLGVDHWLFSFPSESLGLAPVGRMAFFTALTFVTSCGAVLTLSLAASGRFADDLARACGLFTTGIGIVFVLGYLYGSPLLYGGRSIPMALPTAIAFVVLGLSITMPLVLRAAAERHRTTLELRAAHDELENRVAGRTAELEEANEQLRLAVVELEVSTDEAECARQEAVAAERRYRSLVDGLAVGVVFVTPDGIQAANPSAERILGLSADEILRRTVLDPQWRLIHEDGSPVRGDTHPVAASLRTGERGRNFVMGVHRPDDTVAWVEVSSDPLYREGERLPHAAVASFVDITKRRSAEAELRRSEAQLRQAQKMEAVGQLAGGVAHDFNNVLTAIMTYAQLAAEAPDLAAAREDIAEIGNAAGRAANLTRQLLAFSRKQILQPRILDLNSVVQGLEKMLVLLIGGSIEYESRLHTSLGAVEADPGQIEQVLMNLVVNARDAMPRGGRLRIETSNVALDAGYTERYPQVSPGSYVMLVVSDTGVGMDAATQERMFEPFFTTKEKGSGTGLGLSIVYGIVRQSGGHVAAYSEPSRGTTFRVYLPRNDGTSPAGAAEAEAPEPCGGTDTILLVEDDPAVRAVTSRVLAKWGYSVLEAPTPLEAEAIVARHAGPIHLIITDLVMPGMSGRELAAHLLESRPDTPALYMSGHTEDVVIRNALLEPGAAFLSKPFAVEDLLRKVREVLDGADAPRCEAAR